MSSVCARPELLPLVTGCRDRTAGSQHATIQPIPQNYLHADYVGYYLRMNAGSDQLPEDQANLIVEVFRMLADATRIRVLWALTDGESSVNKLAEMVGKSAPSVSQHLAKLRMARLVRTRREGTTIFYSLENEHVRQLVVDAVFNAEHAGPGVPSHHRADPAMHGGTTERQSRNAN